MEIPVAEVVQETDLEYSVDEVVEAQYPEDFEADIFQLGRYSFQSEELPGKAVVKDNRWKKSKDWEEVIQFASNFVDLEQVIKG